jgi:hypothetical protein
MRSPFVDETPRRTEQFLAFAPVINAEERSRKERESGFVLCIRVKEPRGLHLHYCGKGNTFDHTWLRASFITNLIGVWPDGTQIVKELSLIKIGDDCDKVTVACSTPAGAGIFEDHFSGST